MTSDKKKQNSSVHLDEEFDWPSLPRIVINTGYSDEPTTFANHSEALVHYGTYLIHLNTTMRSVTRSLLKGQKIVTSKLDEVLDEAKSINTDLTSLDHRIEELEDDYKKSSTTVEGWKTDIRRAVVTVAVAAFALLVGWGIVSFVEQAGHTHPHTPPDFVVDELDRLDK